MVVLSFNYKVKLGDKDKIGVYEPFPMTILPIYLIMNKEHLALRNNGKWNDFFDWYMQKMC
jgi:hypothetical protein